MIRVAISVEGETEEAFVKDVLYDTLFLKGIVATPINMRGNISLDRIVPDIAKLYHRHDYVTTFYDFYGFKRNNRYIDGNDLEKAIFIRLEEYLSRRDHPLDIRRFRPYIQMYEFEGLLFSDVDGFNILTDVSVEHIEALKIVRQQFSSPEKINNSKETAPSYRIQAVGFDYNKVEHGPIIVGVIGLSAIRDQCPRFNDWMFWLESLGSN